MPFLPDPDDAGFYTHHCSECGHLVRSKSRSAIGHRCRLCAGPINPGTPREYMTYLENRPKARRLNTP